MDENLAMMWLFRAMRGNNKKVKQLLRGFGQAEMLWHCSPNDLRQMEWMEEDMVRDLMAAKDHLDQWQEEMEQTGVRYVSVHDETFPQWLREVYDAPVGLFVQGELPTEQQKCISMIGTRRSSAYGRAMGYDLAKALAQDGFTIISGMAEGIDSICHRGALDGGGKTIAVLGFGHKECYPARNRSLKEEIAAKGTLVSEYPPSTHSGKHTFPRRNRIIAGLSQLLVVVEAGKRSGTVITVDFALDAGRTVMTFPSNITNPLSAGTNQLIQQGCPIITCKEDVYAELGWQKPIQKEEETILPLPPLTKQEQLVYQAIETEPVSMEHLVQTVPLPVAEIQSLLTMLELYGLVERLPQERYRKLS